jgi:RNA polymerase sigma factor (sigma-70 family)
MTPLDLDRARKAAYSLCHQVLRHAQDAEDAAQTVLLQLLDHRAEIQDEKHLRAFLHKACFHVSLNLKRSRRRRRDHERIKAERAEAEVAPTDDAIHEHLATLDDDARELLVGRYFERRTIQELASDAGCSTTAVGKRLEKAREKLRDSLSRAGVLLTGTRMEAFFTSVAPPKAMKSMAAAVLVAVAGIGLLLVSAAHHRSPVDSSPALPAHAGNPPATAGITETPSAAAEAVDDEAPADPPARAGTSAVLDGLKAFLRMQNPDGSWGDGVAPLEGRLVDPVGASALVLVSFYGAGYHSSSKDVYDGRDVGKGLRRSYSWLLERQRPDGTFLSMGDEPLTQALCALAFSECYGMTAIQAAKDPAQRAIDALMRMQNEDGSWGDPTTTLWASEALYSAWISELEIDRRAYGRAKGFYRSQLDAGPNLPAMIGHVFIDRNGTHPALRQTAAWIYAERPEVNRLDYMYWYMGSSALYQYDGPEGSMWKEWNEPLKRAVIGAQMKEGLWPGGTRSAAVVHTSLALLTLEVYYRRENILKAR